MDIVTCYRKRVTEMTYRLAARNRFNRKVDRRQRLRHGVRIEAVPQATGPELGFEAPGTNDGGPYRP